MKTGDLFIAEPNFLGWRTWKLCYYTKETAYMKLKHESVWHLLGPLLTTGVYVYVGETRATNGATRRAYLAPDGKIIYCKYGALVNL